MTTTAEVRKIKRERIERFQDNGSLTLSAEDHAELLKEVAGSNVPGFVVRAGRVVRALGIEIITA